MSYTPYVSFDASGVTRVGCFKCNDTILSRDPQGNLYAWSHKKDIRVYLSDGTYSFIPVCADCILKISDTDIEHFENTMKYGWMFEQTWAFKHSPSRGRQSVIDAGKKFKEIKILRRAS